MKRIHLREGAAAAAAASLGAGARTVDFAKCPMNRRRLKCSWCRR